MSGRRRKKGGPSRRTLFLYPIKSKVKKIDVVVFDIESKDGSSQNKGFTRPFLVGFYDGSRFRSFRNVRKPGERMWFFHRNEVYVSLADPGHFVCTDHVPAGWSWTSKANQPRILARYRSKQPFRGERRCAKCNALLDIDRDMQKNQQWDDAHLRTGGCIDTFCDFLFRTPEGQSFRREDCRIYAHNGGRFDVLFIFAWLIRHADEFGFEITPQMSKVQVLSVWRLEDGEDSARWSFLDSISLMPDKLSKLAKAYGVAGKLDLDLDAEEDDPRWEQYNERDCVALYQVLRRFHEVIETEMGGEVGITAPATAMKLFRRKYLDGKIRRNQHFRTCTTPDTCIGCAHQWVRRGYYGGRTERFREYGEDLRYFDINSSYPYSMTFPMPVGTMLVLDHKQYEKRAKNLRQTHVGFIECTVEIPADCPYPPLPYRKGGKLIFPTGRFSGVWDADELELLYHPMVKGKIVSVNKSVWYEARPVFRDYVFSLYALRVREKELKKKEAAEGLTNEEREELARAITIASIAKILLNALYGKTGQKTVRQKVCHVSESSLPPEGAVPAAPNDGYDADCPIWFVTQHSDASYIVPQIAAHVTALSRKWLFELFAEVHARGGRVYYCDTDSVICDVDLPESVNLGGAKNEHAGKKVRGTFLRPKMYELVVGETRKQAMKGVPQGDEAFFAGNEVYIRDAAEPGKAPVTRAFFDSESALRDLRKGARRAARNADLFEALSKKQTVVSPRLEQFRGMLRRAIKEGSFVSPRLRLVEKSMRSADTKRVQLSDGNTRAIYVEETDVPRIDDQ